MCGTEVGVLHVTSVLLRLASNVPHFRLRPSLRKVQRAQCVLSVGTSNIRTAQWGAYFSDQQVQ